MLICAKDSQKADQAFETSGQLGVGVKVTNPKERIAKGLDIGLEIQKGRTV